MLGQTWAPLVIFPPSSKLLSVFNFSQAHVRLKNRAILLKNKESYYPISSGSVYRKVRADKAPVVGHVSCNSLSVLAIVDFPTVKLVFFSPGGQKLYAIWLVLLVKSWEISAANTTLPLQTWWNWTGHWQAKWPQSRISGFSMVIQCCPHGYPTLHLYIDISYIILYNIIKGSLGI